MKATTPLPDLIERTNRLRERVRMLRARFLLGEATYDEMATAAQEFCRAFDAYHRAKFGKGKKLDWRAVIR